MAAISPAQVKELREKTGAGMMDCKQALSQTNGIMDDAVDWLRKKGLAAAAKKAGRVAAEGLISAVVEGKAGSVVEVNAETDFVARNEQFQQAVRTIASVGLGATGDVEALKAAPYPGSQTSVAGYLTDLVARIGENMSLRRYAKLTVGEGLVASYVHAAVAPGLGRVGVLVALESQGESERLAEVGRQVAMHICASNPQWVTVDQVDQGALERERDVLAEQARASGKAENIIGKMVEGRLRKFYEETVLVEQPWILDPDKKVKAVLDAVAKETGAPVKVTGFVRFALGEGIDKGGSDFAAEVAATLGR